MDDTSSRIGRIGRVALFGVLCAAIIVCTITMVFTIMSQRDIALQNCQDIEKIKGQIRASAERSDKLTPTLDYFKNNKRDLLIIQRQNDQTIKEFAPSNCK